MVTKWKRDLGCIELCKFMTFNALCIGWFTTYGPFSTILYAQSQREKRKWRTIKSSMLLAGAFWGHKWHFFCKVPGYFLKKMYVQCLFSDIVTNFELGSCEMIWGGPIVFFQLKGAPIDQCKPSEEPNPMCYLCVFRSPGDGPEPHAASGQVSREMHPAAPGPAGGQTGVSVRTEDRQRMVALHLRE